MLGHTFLLFILLIFWYVKSYLSQEVRCHKSRENSLCTYYWNISPMIVLFTVLYYNFS
ncbi:hypothetical protein C1645_787036 [Glomus cerebriforme]|uniref:Uncharacterized protein n=1 Tax=Glomus cerebriforme TaxID=658196 RepID=A0A397SGN6_9GLOM|nr:hypothetical protein C1645_787036 [Glomus cerebriforme]